MPDNQELKPCPMCGHPANLETWIDISMGSMDDQQLYYVDCSNCPIKTYDQSNAKEAVHYWNTRVPDTELIAAAENLLKLSACSGQENGIWNALTFAIEKAKSKV